MPHLPWPPETEYEIGAQWRQGAEEATSTTSTQYNAGRGFAACGPNCALHDHAPQRTDDTTAVISRVIQRLKQQGAADAPRMLR